MLRWALKSLVKEPGSLLLSISAAGSALLLVMIFVSVYEGESDQIVAYLENADADIWVTQGGVANMHMVTSYLAEWKADKIRELSGVSVVDSILYLNMVVEGNGNRWFSYLVGLNPSASLAGPWSIQSGARMPKSGEAIVPDVFARISGLELGDSVQIASDSFRISGFSEDTFSMANSVVFMTKDDLEDIMNSFDLVSFILVKADVDANIGALSTAIETSLDNVKALSTEQFVSNDKQMALQMGVETIALMTMIGGALATLLVAFTLYSQVSRQRRELAVAKALGVSNSSLYLATVIQAMCVSVASTLSATFVALLLIPVTSQLIPQVTLHLPLTIIIKISVIGIIVAVLASLVPARHIAKIDPLTAFQH